MISYIKGKLEWMEEDRVFVEAGGIGYGIFVSPMTLSALPPLHSTVQLFTHFAIKDDGASLYGFRSMEELRLFHQLIGVSGLGPKGALALLGAMPAASIRLAIATEDAKTLMRAPGLGRKTAQKIIIDLKDKLKNEELLPQALELDAPSLASPSAKTEALEALLALGYSRSEAVKALSTLEGDDTQALLKAALKQMMK